MNSLILASATFGQIALTFLLVMVALLLIGLILLQKNRGSGLSGAFGGVGGHTAFGTKTGDFLTWVTVGLAAVFLFLSVIANYAFDRQVVASNETQQQPQPATPSSPVQSIPVQASPPDKDGKSTATIPPIKVTPAAPANKAGPQPAAIPPAPAPTTQAGH
jgi:preprotein translocase subunit SecG